MRFAVPVLGLTGATMTYFFVSHKMHVALMQGKHFSARAFVAKEEASVGAPLSYDQIAQSVTQLEQLSWAIITAVAVGSSFRLRAHRSQWQKTAAVTLLIFGALSSASITYTWNFLAIEHPLSFGWLLMLAAALLSVWQDSRSSKRRG